MVKLQKIETTILFYKYINRNRSSYRNEICFELNKKTDRYLTYKDRYSLYLTEVVKDVLDTREHVERTKKGKIKLVGKKDKKQGRKNPRRK